MKLGLEAVDFLKLTSTNHKMHLVEMRSHIWPSIQGDISLRPYPFIVSPAKTQLHLTLLDLYHEILLFHAFLPNRSKLKGP